MNPPTQLPLTGGSGLPILLIIKYRPYRVDAGGRPHQRIAPMATSTREFQVFAMPPGPVCNLECRYCYYLKRKDLYEKGES